MALLLSTTETSAQRNVSSVCFDKSPLIKAGRKIPLAACAFLEITTKIDPLDTQDISILFRLKLEDGRKSNDFVKGKLNKVE